MSGTLNSVYLRCLDVRVVSPEYNHSSRAPGSSSFSVAESILQCCANRALSIVALFNSLQYLVMDGSPCSIRCLEVPVIPLSYTAWRNASLLFNAARWTPSYRLYWHAHRRLIPCRRSCDEPVPSELVAVVADTEHSSAVLSLPARPRTPSVCGGGRLHGCSFPGACDAFCFSARARVLSRVPMSR